MVTAAVAPGMVGAGADGIAGIGAVRCCGARPPGSLAGAGFLIASAWPPVVVKQPVLARTISDVAMLASFRIIT